MKSVVRGEVETMDDSQSVRGGAVREGSGTELWKSFWELLWERLGNLGEI